MALRINPPNELLPNDAPGMPPKPPVKPVHNTAHSTGDPVVVAAGDIASCASNGDEATAHLLARIHGTVLTLGDNAYEDGTASESHGCYDPSWGKYKARTRPAPGNHDYPGIEAAEEAGQTSIGPAKGYF